MAEKDNRDSTVFVETEKVEDGPPKPEPCLIQLSGRETGQQINLKSRILRMGRDPAADIVLDDPHISRNHAQIEYRAENEIIIRDSGSTNGIFVNGQRVTEHRLQDGDKILVGTRLYFKFCFQDTVEQSYQQNLFRAANIDSLTQLYNKKFFIDSLAKEASFSRRNKEPLCLMMLDIDFFKQVNDTHGHQAGDHVLKTLGQYFLKNLRMENVACRFGGEEFAIILRNVDLNSAFQIAERLRAGIEKEPIEYLGQKISVTMSIGISSFGIKTKTIDDLIRIADENLYEAKERGRNQIILKQAA